MNIHNIPPLKDETKKANAFGRVKQSSVVKAKLFCSLFMVSLSFVAKTPGQKKSAMKKTSLTGKKIQTNQGMRNVLE